MLLSALSVLGLYVSAEDDPYKTSWQNGDLKDWKSGMWYGEDVPISYEYYFLKIMPADSRAKGFYPMTKATSGKYLGYYTADETGGESGESSDMRNNLYESYIDGANMRSSAHYLAAVVFTAPWSGEVTITYQFKSNNNQDKVSCSLLVAKENYNGTWEGNSDANVLARHDVDHLHAIDEKTITLTVEKGEKVYFIDHARGNKDYDNLQFWISDITYNNVTHFTPTEAKVVGKGLAAADELTLRFFVECDNNTNPDAVFTVETADGTEEIVAKGTQWIDTEGIGGRVVTKKDNIFYYSVPLSSTRTGDKVTISIKTKDGKELLTENNSYTVREYCQYWIDGYNKDGSNYSVAKVCASILLYGKTAQISLGYKTHDLPTVDSGLVADILENGLFPEGGSDGTRAGALSATVAKVPTAVGEGYTTVSLTSAELMRRIRYYELAENTVYEVTDGEGLSFNSSDRNYYFNLKNCVIKITPDAGKAALTVASGARGLELCNFTLIVNGGAGAMDIAKNTKDITLSHVNVMGNTGYGLQNAGENVLLTDSTVSGTVTNGILGGGEALSVTDCSFEGLTVGITDTSDGAVIENNIFHGCETAVLTKTANTVVWYNSISGGKYGVRATAAKSEISAVMGECYNVLAACNRISGAEVSVDYVNVSNGVALLNVADSISVVGGTNVYVNENVLSGKLTLTGNDYIIANGNIIGQMSAEGNSNVNGDNLTDLSKRSETGVNEELLPHINSEQFVGMTRRSELRTLKSSKRLAEYIGDGLAEQSVVIVPPGAYFNDAMSYTDISNVTVYAYGVLSEMLTASATAMKFTNSENVTVKGLFIGNSTYPHIQGTVTAVAGQNSSSGDHVNATYLSFVPDPGYDADYSVHLNTAGRIFKPGMDYSYSCVDYYGDKTYNLGTNTNTVNNVALKGLVEIGDRIAFRGSSAAQGISFTSCSGMKLEDVTIYCAGGFAESDSLNDIAPVLHRYAVVRGPAPLLTGKVSDPYNVTWKDSYGRLRSAKPMTTTIDATHSSAARTGIQIISCLFEWMEDDAGNINSYYGLAVGYDAATNTLTYRRCNVNGYELLPPPFRTGDTVMLYTMEGKFIARVTAESATVSAGEADDGNAKTLDDIYTVKLSEDIDLGDGSAQVVVQNASASGNGFLIDNVLQRNSKWSGFRIKADCTEDAGVIKNSTFQGVSTLGIAMMPQYTEWPEVGYAVNVQIINNEFIEMCAHSEPWTDWEDNGTCVPIRFGGGKATSDLAYCLHKDILISGNVFDSRHSKYAIWVTSVEGLTVTENTFTERYGYSAGTDTQAPISVVGGNGIVISDNVYPTGVTVKVNVNTETTANVSGTDVQ